MLQPREQSNLVVLLISSFICCTATLFPFGFVAWGLAAPLWFPDAGLGFDLALASGGFWFKSNCLTIFE